MQEEGYIKFRSHWEVGEALPAAAIAQLNACRAVLYQQGLIGAYADGIGYGNVSERLPDGQFLITGSATGRLPVLDGRHFSRVTAVAEEANALWCVGPVAASSESMSHAAVYACCPEARMVVHVHSLALWERLLRQVPATPATVAYGTPEMAAAIRELFRTTAVARLRIFAMEGHREGLFTFGEDMASALAPLEAALGHRF